MHEGCLQHDCLGARRHGTRLVFCLTRVHLMVAYRHRLSSLDGGGKISVADAPITVRPSPLAPPPWQGWPTQCATASGNDGRACIQFDMLIQKPHMSVIAISTETTFVIVVKSEAVVSNNVSAATARHTGTPVCHSHDDTNRFQHVSSSSSSLRL